jgi:hypothetical protein
MSHKCGNLFPPKVNNSTVEDLNDSEMNEISTRELKRMMARMYNHLNKFKENKSNTD